MADALSALGLAYDEDDDDDDDDDEEDDDAAHPPLPAGAPPPAPTAAALPAVSLPPIAAAALPDAGALLSGLPNDVEDYDQDLVPEADRETRELDRTDQRWAPSYGKD